MIGESRFHGDKKAETGSDGRKDDKLILCHCRPRSTTEINERLTAKVRASKISTFTIGVSPKAHRDDELFCPRVAVALF